VNLNFSAGLLYMNCKEEEEEKVEEKRTLRMQKIIIIRQE
jgi:hypothetical protein